MDDGRDEVDADLIVVGNKGMLGAKRFFLNPVPEKVIDLSDRDVLIARTVAQVASELRPGEGGIIVQAGERLAAFMDDEGELHLMSAGAPTWGAPSRGTAARTCSSARATARSSARPARS